MTEDSDDDDRMERADRIRRMREGRRSRGRTDGAGEAETAEEPATDESDEATATEETAAEQAAEPDADDANAADGANAASEETTDGQAVPEEAAPSSTVDGTTEPEPASADGQAEDAADTATDTNGAAPATADDAGGFEFEQANGNGAAEQSDADELAVETAAEAAELAAGEKEAAALAETQRDVAASVTADDAERAVAGLGGATTFAIPDQATTVSRDDDGLDAEGTVAAARAAAAAGRRTAAARDRTRVLEFDLGDERFCLDIDYVEEIVELENMTRVPNSPSYVEGVVDLRGQVTAIINPKDALDVGNEGRGDLIIVFDSEQMDEQGHLGWVVDEVRQVTPVSEDEVNESPDEDAEHINGVINREGEDDFVVWTTPELALNSS